MRRTSFAIYGVLLVIAFYARVASGQSTQPIVIGNDLRVSSAVISNPQHAGVPARKVPSSAIQRAHSPLLAGVTLSAKQNAILDTLDATYLPRLKAITGSGTPSPDQLRRAQALYAEYLEKSHEVLTPSQRTVLVKNQAALAATQPNVDIRHLPVPRKGEQ